jgi:hypothetical protein
MVNPLNMQLSSLAPTLARDGANITKAGGSLKVQIESGMTLHTSNSKLLFRLGLFVSPTTDYCLPPFGFVCTLVNWRLTTDLCLLALFLSRPPARPIRRNSLSAQHLSLVSSDPKLGLFGAAALFVVTPQGVL